MATNHFRLLDGLRGAAALAVVAYHFGERGDLPGLMPRGYLAVDFFFVLSGLVLAHAYLGRLRGALTASRFVMLRLIRLWPMLVPGTLLGAVMEFWRPNAGPPARHLIEVAAAAILGCVALPWPFHSAMEQTIFPINGPVWSLFLEIVANLIFVAVAKSAFPRAAMGGLAAAGAVGLAGLALVTGKVDMGPLVENWPGGLPRVLFSFFAGVLLHAHRHRIPAVASRYAAGAYPLILLAVFMVPPTPGPLNAAVDLAAILVVFPLIVGSAANANPGRAGRLCDMAGALSYPLYAIHYPVIRAICFVLIRHPLPVPARLGVAAVSLALVVALSWAALRLYDRPMRRLLTRHLARAPDGPPIIPATRLRPGATARAD